MIGVTNLIRGVAVVKIFISAFCLVVGFMKVANKAENYGFYALLLSNFVLDAFLLLKFEQFLL